MKGTQENLITEKSFRKILKEELSNFVTKDDLKKELSNFVTRDEFKLELKKAFLEYTPIIMKEIDKRFFSVIETITRVNREYYTEQIERYLGALKEAIADENRGYRDMVVTVKERTENHEDRILFLEEKIA